MNIVITLPKELIQAIIEGRKTVELRKVKPRLMKLGEDGFFCVEKGTQFIRCWCRVDDIDYLFGENIKHSELATRAAVSEEFIMEYAKYGKLMYQWHIGKVIVIEEDSLVISSLFVDRNPQQFAYCPLSYGESY